jgi:hypothetical protein
VISNTATVTTTASQVIAASSSQRTVYLHVSGAGTVYLGGSDVTSTNGLMTEKNAVPFQIVIPPHQELWAVTASGSETLQILKPTSDDE